ncbi:hypothetical protein [Ruegeria sp.]|uniref:hypothetical protein n=1 Tax=Ruegeria sp. TaxID=1879320 RepID=UPI00230D2AD8|nr:hypothetical protein [Ruegeria sp.]MDA7966958.1 hypothetical protein [Ruegeria sp.]
MAFELIDPFPGMSIGRGVDTTTGDLKPSIAVNGDIGAQQGAGGASGGFEFIRVDTSDQFDQAINAEASVSYGTSIFGKSQGASAKTSYRERCKYSNSATFSIIRFTIDNPFESFTTTPVLTDEATELLSLRKMERFRERFGNRFIGGRFTGVEFFACLRIESSSIERQQEIRASAEASFGAFSASGSGENLQSSLNSEDSIQILVFQHGGLIQPVFSFEETLNLARTVADQAQSGLGVPTAYTLEEYRELALPADDLSFVQRQHADATLKKLGRDYRALETLMNDIDYVLRNQQFFKNPKINKLNNALTQIAELLNRIVDAADTCVRDATQCELIPMNLPDIPFPQRKSGETTPGIDHQGPSGLVNPQPADDGPVLVNPLFAQRAQLFQNMLAQRGN